MLKSVYGIGVFALSYWAVGCGPERHYVKPEDNDRRMVMIWESPRPEYKPISCLEYNTAVDKEKTRKVDVNPNVTFMKGVTGNVNVQVETGEKLAKIYNVSDILQFAHAQLYRVCEMYANGVIDGPQYVALFQNISDNTNSLLLVEMSSGLTAPVVQEVSKSIQSVSSTGAENITDKISNAAAAKTHEAMGFVNIDQNDYAKALENFNQASKLYPTLHNVAEIREALADFVKSGKTGSAEEQKKFKKEIAEKWSWGAPKDIIENFR